MRGIQPLDCRRLTGLRRQNTWCALLSEILKARYLLKEQMRFCWNVLSVSRRMSILPFTGSCLQVFIRMQAASEITILQKRMGA